MAAPRFSLRLEPGVFKAGAEVTLKVEYFEQLGTPCQIKLLEVDDVGVLDPKAGKSADIATFEVVAQKVNADDKSPKPPLKFTSAERIGAPPSAGAKGPRFKVRFAGTKDCHEVVVTKSAKGEGQYFEVGLKVFDQGGKQLWPTGPKHVFAHCSVGGARYAKYDCKKMNFHNDSAVVQKVGAETLCGVLEYVQKNLARNKDPQLQEPRRRLLILGHTDAVGTVANNDALSDLRAQAAVCLLRGHEGGDKTANRLAYIEVCKQKWCTRDAQDFLSWVNDKFEWAGTPSRLDPGSPTSDTAPTRQAMNADTARAILQFDQRFRAQPRFQRPDAVALTDAAVATTVPDAFWGQMYDVYSDHLRMLLELDAAKYDALLKSISWLDTRSVGCGKRYLEVNTQTSCADNRRIEFLFFEDDHVPASFEREALGPLYAPGRWAVDQVKCFEVPPREIDLRDATTKHVLFVIDVSGSMSLTDGLDGPGASRLARLKAALLKLITKHRLEHPDGLMNILAFGGKSNLAGEGTIPVIKGWHGDALQLVDLTTLKTFIDEQVPRGGTPTGKALVQALTQTTGPGGAAPPAELTVYLLSDGAPTPTEDADPDGVKTRAKILAKAKELRETNHPLWKIDTFAFREGDGGVVFLQFLKDLAAQNRGAFSDDRPAGTP